MRGELTFYGASDDLVEFVGDFVEEFNVYDIIEFRITINEGDGDQSQFQASAQFGFNGWDLRVWQYTGQSNIPVEVVFCQVEDNEDNDPAVTFFFSDDAKVTVEHRYATEDIWHA
jgi:hypothetical protein